MRQRTSAGGGSRCTGRSGNRAGGGKRNGTVFLRKREADRSARCACRRCQGHGFADGRAGGRFDPAEAKAAVDAGLQSVSLGTRILRCETAPIAALAAVLYAGGNHVRRNKGSVKHWQKTMWVKSQFLRKSIPPTRCSQYSACACSACWY